jgi:hypothetical protein
MLCTAGQLQQQGIQQHSSRAFARIRGQLAFPLSRCEPTLCMHDVYNVVLIDPTHTKSNNKTTNQKIHWANNAARPLNHALHA